MYRPFEGLLFKYRQLAKQDGRPVLREDVEKTLNGIFKQTVLLSYEGLHEGTIKQDSVLALLEHVHYLLTHRVIYIPTHFAEKLADSDMRLDLEHLRLPYTLFEICFDDSFMYAPGIQMPSMLISAPCDDHFFGVFTSFFEQNTRLIYESLGIPTDKIRASEVSPKFKNVFGIRYQSPVDAMGLCHANIKPEKVKGQRISKIVDELSHHTMGITPLNETEVAVQKKLVNIAFGVICYLNTKDPDVLEYKNRNRCSFGTVSPNGLIIGSRFSPASWFIREGHVVFLRHKRYRRDETGSIRCIWRKGHSVNRGAKPLVPEPRVEEVNHG